MIKAITILFLLFNTCCFAHKLLGPLETGWKGQSVCEKLSENSHENILLCTFPVGIGHEKHKHKANFGYAISGGTMRITDEKGTKTVKLKTGSYFNSKGKKWHKVLNVGPTKIVYLILESK